MQLLPASITLLITFAALQSSAWLVSQAVGRLSALLSGAAS
jgi:hypothetical protein